MLDAPSPIAILSTPVVTAPRAESPRPMLLLAVPSSLARAVSSEDIAIEVPINSPIPPPPEAAAQVSPPVLPDCAVKV